MRLASRAVALVACLSWGIAAAGPRLAVLNQVDLPHNYYWRELYLPQLTTGPSAAAFLPDGQELVYSMAGSLWRQRIGADEAVELTHADGAYDYQPDVAPDGASVVFARYDGRAIELWRLDFASGREQALTANGGVNVEPRISPDGKRLAYVSTGGSGHFNLKIADLGPAGLANERYGVAPRKSLVPRYYYSQHDHAINPSWSPDGRCVYFVSNEEVPWGTGFIRGIAVDGGKGCDAPNRHREESTWAARPEVAPDGRRMLFSSYHGREWHQLFLSTVEHAAPIPLTYGAFDRRNARWSPDGARIAYISNEGGNTSLWVQEFFGGARQAVVAKSRRWLRPAATLKIVVTNGAGRAMPARVSVLGGDRRWHAPADAWMHGDEAYDRDALPSETHYFHCASPCTLTLPAGRATVVAQRGFRYLPQRETVEVTPGPGLDLRLSLATNDLAAVGPAVVSADLHVHMNYGGNYRATPETLLAQMEAEDLDVVHNLIVNKEERITDVAEFGGAQTSATGRLLLHAQEYHTSFWGHLGVLHLADHLLLPDYVSYRHTALTSPWPHNGAIADLAHAQGGLVGYAHPFDFPVDITKPLTYQLPADAANGKLDYLEVMGFSDHRITADIWYRLLNLGFRIPAGAGTDAMTNYASLRGPIGLVRVFLDVPDLSPAALREALKAGRGFVSNGPLLGFQVEGVRPGGTIDKRGGRLKYGIAFRSPLSVDHLEIVQNGRVIESIRLPPGQPRVEVGGWINAAAGGWILLRAWSGKPDPLLLDLYPYATTNPVWLAGPAPAAPEDAAYFVTWMDRVIEGASARDDWNSEAERRETLAYLEAARGTFRALAKKP